MVVQWKTASKKANRPHKGVSSILFHDFKRNFEEIFEEEHNKNVFHTQTRQKQRDIHQISVNDKTCVSPVHNQLLETLQQ